MVSRFQPTEIYLNMRGIRSQTFHEHFPSTHAHTDIDRIRLQGVKCLIFGNINIGNTSINTIYLLRDRKSTRLNSSHVKISYAVFCLKKKKINIIKKKSN